MEKFDDEWYSSILSQLNLTGDVRGEDVEFPVSPLSRHVAPLKLVLELQQWLSASVKIHQFVFIKSSTNIPSTCPLNVTAARPSQDLQIEFYKWDKYIARKFISGYLIWTSKWWPLLIPRSPSQISGQKETFVGVRFYWLKAWCILPSWISNSIPYHLAVRSKFRTLLAFIT